MIKLPRDVSGEQLAKALTKLGYTAVRQRGSHLTLATQQAGKHTLHVPMHQYLKPGLLSSLLSQVQDHFGISREQLIELLNL